MNSIVKRSQANTPRSFFTAVICCLFVFGVNAKTLIFESDTSAVTPDSSSPQSSAAVQDERAPSRTLSTTRPPNSAASTNANAELFFMIEQLKREVSQLRGIVEQQAYQLNNLERSSKRRYQDMDARVLNLSRQVSNPAAQPPKPDNEPAIVPVQQQKSAGIPAPPPTEAQKQAYAEAYALVKEKKFSEAIDALHSFIEKYPEGELTGNAYYWLGEVYLVLPKLEQAKQAFMIVVKSFDGHRKVADSMFKLAVTFDRLHDPENSEKYLELVRKNYPDSTAAKLANNYKIVR